MIILWRFIGTAKIERGELAMGKGQLAKFARLF